MIVTMCYSFSHDYHHFCHMIIMYLSYVAPIVNQQTRPEKMVCTIESFNLLQMELQSM